MERRSIEAVFRTLNEMDVRYLVTGGLAVLAHGAMRLTHDIDLVVALDPENASRAVRALEALDYQPTVPVTLGDFARPELRQSWIEDKDAKVLQVASEKHRTARVDLFLEEPFEFEQAWSRAYRAEVAPGLQVPFVSLDDLLEMKETAGRPQDLLDASNLRKLHDR